MPSRRHDERLAMGLAAIYTLSEAAAALPMADREAREWLIANDLVSYALGGRPTVVWLDVLDALRKRGDRPEPRRRSSGAGLPQVRL